MVVIVGLFQSSLPVSCQPKNPSHSDPDMSNSSTPCMQREQKFYLEMSTTEKGGCWLKGLEFCLLFCLSHIIVVYISDSTIKTKTFPQYIFRYNNVLQYTCHTTKNNQSNRDEANIYIKK